MVGEIATPHPRPVNRGIEGLWRSSVHHCLDRIETSTPSNYSGWNPFKIFPAETSQHRSQVIQHKFFFGFWVCALSFQDLPVAIAKTNNVGYNCFRNFEFTTFERLRIETIQSIGLKSQGVGLEVARYVNRNWVLGKFSIGSWERLSGLTIWSVYQWVDIQYVSTSRS